MNLKVLREEREKKFICEVLPGVLRGSVVVLNSRNEIRTRGLSKMKLLYFLNESNLWFCMNR